MADQLDALVRAVQQTQPQLSEVFYRYKANNDAIKHLAVYSHHGQLLARSPDDEAQSKKLLEAQYLWLARLIGPAIGSIKAACEEFSKNSRRQVTKDFGRPRVFRLQTDDGDAISQIYATPIDSSSLLFIVITSRAATRRNAYVVNEVLLLEDIENLVREISTVLEIDVIFPVSDSATLT